MGAAVFVLLIVSAANVGLWLRQGRVHDVAATRYALRDAQGVERAVIGLDDSGSPGLALYDAAGVRRVWLAVAADTSPKLLMYDETGRPFTSLGWGAQGAPFLGMMGRDGVGHAVLHLGPDGVPYLRLTGSTTSQSVVATVVPGKGARVRVEDGADSAELVPGAPASD